MHGFSVQRRPGFGSEIRMAACGKRNSKLLRTNRLFMDFVFGEAFPVQE